MLVSSSVRHLASGADGDTERLILKYKYGAHIQSRTDGDEVYDSGDPSESDIAPGSGGLEDAEDEVYFEEEDDYVHMGGWYRFRPARSQWWRVLEVDGGDPCASSPPSRGSVSGDS